MNSIEAFEQFLNGEMDKAGQELTRKSTRSVATTRYRMGYYDAVEKIWENFQWVSDEYHERDK
jgi:hypothetical protein